MNKKRAILKNWYAMLNRRIINNILKNESFNGEGQRKITFRIFLDIISGIDKRSNFYRVDENLFHNYGIIL